MRLSRMTRCFVSVMAVVAIMMAAFAPSISQLLAAQGSSEFVEICAADGAKWVQARGQGDHAPAHDLLHHVEHCPYCSVHAQAPVLPSPDAVLPPMIALGGNLPRAFLNSPRTAHAWVAARPRGPPLAA